MNIRRQGQSSQPETPYRQVADRADGLLAVEATVRGGGELPLGVKQNGTVNKAWNLEVARAFEDTAGSRSGVDMPYSELR